MRAAMRPRRRERPWAVIALLCALVLPLLVPQGFMVAEQDGRATIAICTGHGAAFSIADLTGHQDKHRPSKSEAPCAFVGHGVATAPPIAALVAAPLALPTQTPLALPSDLAPGRGLAAPPPPSQGPPLHLI